MAVKSKWIINCFDISVAYLHSKLDEEIYVSAPIEFRPEWTGKVTKLNKAMYGLKQEGQFWWLHFQSIMLKLNFIAEELDQLIYCCTKGETIIYLWMNVDDGVIFSNDQEAVSKLRIQLTEDFKVKWEDKLTRIVEINFKQEDNKLVLSQTDFARQIIQHFERKSNSPLLQTLSVLPETKLQTSQGIPIEQKWYQSIIGSLYYLVLGTRADLS
ncbi:hypothetical protein O181_100093 [Austropuccinia psidii MF-1]|uniref:Reverse transcriptase Ty1/copia-type domain-containing protein n=1 Tax=Austropuccinia psidii MF-1 TaxID=1389203 RepID=A0A9Q3JC37_9BASI|nr:hypothetical protein [Austropuccinia psidii MF-1]